MVKQEEDWEYWIWLYVVFGGFNESSFGGMVEVRVDWSGFKI